MLDVVVSPFWLPEPPPVGFGGSPAMPPTAGTCVVVCASHAARGPDYGLPACSTKRIASHCAASCAALRCCRAAATAAASGVDSLSEIAQSAGACDHVLLCIADGLPVLCAANHAIHGLTACSLAAAVLDTVMESLQVLKRPSLVVDRMRLRTADGAPSH